LQKELEAGARRIEQGESRHRAEVQTLQAQLGTLRQQVGVMEGKLEAAHGAHAASVNDLSALREKLAATQNPDTKTRRVPPRRADAHLSRGARKPSRAARKATAVE
jgi:hypothetical protein